MGGRLFTVEDAWYGGFYELALEVGPRSDDRLRAALTALWTYPHLSGCFRDRDREPDDQPRSAPDSLESGTHELGVALLPNGTRVACGTCPIREDEGSDWLVFYLAMGSLGLAYPVGGFPVGTESEGWRSEVDDWLAEVGLWVARSASFQLGLIGFEVSGSVYAADVSAQGIPTVRHIGYLWPSAGSVTYHRRSPG